MSFPCPFPPDTTQASLREARAGLRRWLERRSQGLSPPGVCTPLGKLPLPLPVLLANLPQTLVLPACFQDQTALLADRQIPQ